MATSRTPAQQAQDNNKDSLGRYQHAVSGESPTALGSIEYLTQDYSNVGLKGHAFPAGDIESDILPNVKHVFRTEGGREIMIGRDWDGDPGATIKDGDDEIHHVSERTTYWDAARYVLRDRVSIDAARKTFGENIEISHASTSDGDQPRNIEMALYANGVEKYMVHDFKTRSTTMEHYVDGVLVPMNEAEVNSFFTQAGVAATGAKPILDESFEEISRRILEDKDLDAGYRGAFGEALPE